VLALALVFACSAAAIAADISGYLEDQTRRAQETEQSTAFSETMILARQGDADAQYRLGLAYRNGWGAGKDPISAITWLREAADRGHARAQHVLGAMYEIGEGVPANDERALDWYRKAAAQGLTEAQVSLANLIEHAGTSESELAEALMWYEIAAASGHVSAERGRVTLKNRLPEALLAEARERAANWKPAVQ
jgi:uncharacterized protein